MRDWVLLEKEAEIKEIITSIKKRCRGHYYTNYQPFYSKLDGELACTEAFWSCEGDNLYLIKRQDDFYRLFYVVGEVTHFSIEHFPESVRNGILVCDIVETEKNIRQEIILERLKQMDFQVYKKYHMWMCTDGNYKTPRFRGLKIVDESDLARLSSIYDIFDSFADMLPVKRGFQAYIHSVKARKIRGHGS